MNTSLSAKSDILQAKIDVYFAFSGYSGECVCDCDFIGFANVN